MIVEKKKINVLKCQDPELNPFAIITQSVPFIQVIPEILMKWKNFKGEELFKINPLYQCASLISSYRKCLKEGMSSLSSACAASYYWMCSTE